MSDDERGCVYVHTEVPSSDDVRTFYEIPEVVAAHIHATAPDKPFVEALVTVFEGIDAYRDALADLGARLQDLKSTWDEGFGGNDVAA